MSFLANIFRGLDYDKALKLKLVTPPTLALKAEWIQDWAPLFYPEYSNQRQSGRTTKMINQLAAAIYFLSRGILQCGVQTVVLVGWTSSHTRALSQQLVDRLRDLEPTELTCGISEIRVRFSGIEIRVVCKNLLALTILPSAIPNLSKTPFLFIPDHYVFEQLRESPIALSCAELDTFYHLERRSANKAFVDTFYHEQNKS